MAAVTAGIYIGCEETTDNLITTPTSAAHPSGWRDSSSTNFHGKFIQDNKLWNLKKCQGCHGADYKGGSTGMNCNTCHIEPGGPENCMLCHGSKSGNINPPKALNGNTSIEYLGVGMHEFHLDTTKYSKNVECSECHKLFNNVFSDSNHIGNMPDGIADINFGSLAKTSIGGGIFPVPVWNRSSGSCSEVYCHGNFKNGNRDAIAVWTDSASVKCGTCHGDPNTGNPNPKPNGTFVPPHSSTFTINNCYLCHGSVISNLGKITNKNLHVNGIINY